MRKIIVLMVGLVVLLFTACPEGDEPYNIRFDGVYRREIPEYPGFYTNLRFYEDEEETVISRSTNSTVESLRNDSTFSKDGQYISKGTYSINGNNISFQTTHSDGGTNYNGKIYRNKLILNVANKDDPTDSANNLEFLFTQVEFIY